MFSFPTLLLSMFYHSNRKQTKIELDPERRAFMLVNLTTLVWERCMENLWYFYHIFSFPKPSQNLNSALITQHNILSLLLKKKKQKRKEDKNYHETVTKFTLPRVWLIDPMSVTLLIFPSWWLYIANSFLVSSRTLCPLCLFMLRSLSGLNLDRSCPSGYGLS